MWFLLSTTLPWASLFDDIMGSTPALSSDSIMQTPFSTSVIDLPAAAPPADSATSRFSDIMSSSPPPALSSDSIIQTALSTSVIELPVDSPAVATDDEWTAAPAQTSRSSPAAAERFLVSIASVDRRFTDRAPQEAAAALFCLDQVGGLPVHIVDDGEPWPCARWVLHEAANGAMELRSGYGAAALCLTAMADGVVHGTASVRARRCTIDGLDRAWRLETAASGAVQIASAAHPTLCVALAPLSRVGKSQQQRRPLLLEACAAVTAASTSERHRVMWWWSDIAPAAHGSSSSSSASADDPSHASHVAQLPWWMRSAWEHRCARKTRSVLRQLEDRTLTLQRDIAANPSSDATPLPPTLSATSKTENAIKFIVWRVEAIVTLDTEATYFRTLHPALVPSDVRRRDEQKLLRSHFLPIGEIGAIVMALSAQLEGLNSAGASLNAAAAEPLIAKIDGLNAQLHALTTRYLPGAEALIPGDDDKSASLLHRTWPMDAGCRGVARSAAAELAQIARFDPLERAEAFEAPTCEHSDATGWIGKRIGGGVRGIELSKCPSEEPFQLCAAAHEDACVREFPDIYEEMPTSFLSNLAVGCDAAHARDSVGAANADVFSLFKVAEKLSDTTKLRDPERTTHTFTIALFIPHPFVNDPLHIDRGGESTPVWAAAIADQPPVLDELHLELNAVGESRVPLDAKASARREKRRGAFAAKYVARAVAMGEWIRDNAPGWMLRIYLAPELRWTTQLLLAPGVVQLRIMARSSIRSLGMMWRWLAFDDTSLTAAVASDADHDEGGVTLPALQLYLAGSVEQWSGSPLEAQNSEKAAPLYPQSMVRWFTLWGNGTEAPLSTETPSHSESESDLAEAESLAQPWRWGVATNACMGRRNEKEGDIDPRLLDFAGDNCQHATIQGLFFGAKPRQMTFSFRNALVGFSLWRIRHPSFIDFRYSPFVRKRKHQFNAMRFPLPWGRGLWDYGFDEGFLKSVMFHRAVAEGELLSLVAHGSLTPGTFFEPGIDPLALRCRNVYFLEASWSARHAGNAVVEHARAAPGVENARPFRGSGTTAGQSFFPRREESDLFALDNECRHHDVEQLLRKEDVSTAAHVLLPLAKRALETHVADTAAPPTSLRGSAVVGTDAACVRGIRASADAEAAVREALQQLGNGDVSSTIGVCCNAECGSCGGWDCSLQPHGWSHCCVSGVLASARWCSSNEAPCLFDGPAEKEKEATAGSWETLTEEDLDELI